MTNPETKVRKILEISKASAMKRGGRPRKPNAKNKGEIIKLRISKEDKDLLSVACYLLSMSFTTLLLDNGIANAKALLKAEGYELPK
tara:strand:- start:18223 stop:18483 length:261 start_codon:yes stop_codon:yes gene_type:complete